MDLLNTKSFTAFCLAGAVFCMSQLACAQQDAGAHVQQLPLTDVVHGLADFKTFRMTSAQFDTLVAPYCKKVRDRNFKPMILATHRCAPNSGITEIKMDSREGFGSPLPNYMMTFSVDFAIEKYAAVKTQVENKLGRAKPRGKDFLEWRYAADKALNAVGNPLST